MKQIILYIITLLVVQVTSAQAPASVNVWEVKRGGITRVEEVLQLPASERSKVSLYLDGFGRPIQKVTREGSPQKKDIVDLYVYDELGRETKRYLPYVAATTDASFQPDMLVAQKNFYQGVFPEEDKFYLQTDLENSALSRVVKTMKPGMAFAGNGKGIVSEYQFNTVAEKVHQWRIGMEEGDLPVTRGELVYDNGTLFKETGIAEDGAKVITYTDMQGRVVLNKTQDKSVASSLSNEHAGWLCTYYVYDDFNNLRFVISPRAVVWLDTHSWGVTVDIADALCDRFFFDGKGRMVLEKRAGAGSIETVYDRKNRPVFVRTPQDAGKWMVTLYDNLDRKVKTGFFSGLMTRKILQEQLEQKEVANVNVGAGVTAGSGYAESLMIALREPGRPLYAAAANGEIVFTSGFESEANAAFETLLAAGAPAASPQQLVVAGNPLPDGITMTTLAVHYYDDYAYTAAKPFSAAYQFATNNNPNTLETKAGGRTLGRETGRQVRIVNDDDFSTDGFLTTTLYYDDRGNLIQYSADNYKNGIDITTQQFDFAGKLLAVSEQKNVPGTTIKQFYENARYDYDDGGRLVGVSRSYAGGAWKKLKTLEYNVLGQTGEMKIAPEYQGNVGLEQLKYEYNLQGRLTGINREYVLNTNAASQWDHYFGLVLGYDKQENGLFSAGNYTDMLTGVAWRSQGDNKPRRYNYEYTLAGQLGKALFSEKESPAATGWNTSGMDASVPVITYDENGNITALKRTGLIPGQAAPVSIDDLSYNYERDGFSNRLVAITDAVSENSGKTGDFANVAGTPAQQYLYDNAGNMVKDLNNKIGNDQVNGVFYNILGKPWKVLVTDKYEMQFVYDAEGRLLARKLVDKLHANTVSWRYTLGNLVMQDNKVLYFTHEAGKLRVSQTVSSAAGAIPAVTVSGNNGLEIDGRPAFFDYYITDQQSSTRAVVTEEMHIEDHMATMEISNAERQFYEEIMFGKVDASGAPTAGNELIATRDDIIPAWTSHYNDAANKKASRLRKSAPIGANSLLKVMAGDELNLRVEYFYNETPVSGNNGLSSVVNTLLGAFATNGASVEAGAKDAAAQLQQRFLNSGDLVAYLNNPDNGTANMNVPQAYLNWLFFDENFNLVSYNPANEDGSGAVRVNGAGDGRELSRTGIKAPSNGYVFVYVSNTSDMNVWFDNLTIRHVRSRLLEERHYDPYGLEIMAISSTVFGAMDNEYLYQGDYSEYIKETGWNDFALRTYDSRIGRFLQQDPYHQFSSPYTGMGNNPVNMIDPTGGFSLGTVGDVTGSVWGDRLLATGIGAGVGFLVDKLTGGKGGWGLGAGAFAGLGVTYIQEIPGLNFKAVAGVVAEYGEVLLEGAGTLYSLRDVFVTVTNEIVRTTKTFSYPVSNSNKASEMYLYEVPVYKVIVAGSDNDGNTVTKAFDAIRFGVKNTAYGEPRDSYVQGLEKEEVFDGVPWQWDYKPHSFENGEMGAWVIKGDYLIHDGPDDGYLGASNGCVEILGDGKFGEFNDLIVSLSGATAPDRAAKLRQVGKSKVLHVTYEPTQKPKLKVIRSPKKKP